MSEELRENSDRKVKALAERVFLLMDQLSPRIARAKTEELRGGLRLQISGSLEKLRPYVVGKEKKQLTPSVAYRLQGEYTIKGTQVEDALIESESDEAPSSAMMATFKENCLPIPRNKAIEFQPYVARQLVAMSEIDQGRGVPMDPAWSIFYHESMMKRLSINPFPGDDWYAGAMAERNPLLRKMVLPLVVIDMVDQAATEGASSHPRHEIVMEHRHRALNALDELIEIWDSEMPVVADKYRAVKAALDHELMTLAQYHRYQKLV